MPGPDLSEEHVLLSTIVRQGRMLRNLCYVGSYDAASKMAECCVHPAEVGYTSATRVYRVADLGINLGPAHHGLLAGLWHARVLQRAGVQFANVGNEIIAQTPFFRVPVENEDELFILREVVADGIYNLIPSAPGAVVLDIGMNVGFTSLQFAAQPRVAAVWAYEPVAATYDRALGNLERNPELAVKIKAHNYGLCDTAGEMTFHYSPGWRGVAGVDGPSAEFRRTHRIEDLSRVTVTVRSASDVVSELRSEHPAAELIVKTDCEGCEYRIVAAMQREGLLHQVDVFLIEWHKHGPTELVQALAGEGFVVLSSTTGQSTGMIYACRRTESAAS